MIFWIAAVFLLPVSPIWPPRRPFLPYGRPNLALAGLLVKFSPKICTLDPQSTVKLLTRKHATELIERSATINLDVVGYLGTITACDEAATAETGRLTRHLVIRSATGQSCSVTGQSLDWV